MIEEKLRKMGLVIPAAPRPAGAYIPVAITGKIAFVSGQIPLRDGIIVYTGKVNDHTIKEARESARLCAINILAQLKGELENLDKIARIVRISGFVNSGPAFSQHPKVIDAASNFLFEIFGDAGRHSRVALGVSSLPLDAMTEIDALVELH